MINTTNYYEPPSHLHQQAAATVTNTNIINDVDDDDDGTVEPILILSNSSSHIWVRTTHPMMSTELQNFLVSTCEPVTRPHFFNEYAMTPVSLCAAASERVYTPQIIAYVLLKYSGLDSLPQTFQKLLRTMDGDRRLQLVLEPKEDNEEDDDTNNNNNSNNNRNNNENGIRRGRDDPNPPLSVISAVSAMRKKDASTQLCYMLTSASRSLLESIINSNPKVARLIKTQRIGGESKLIFSDVTYSSNLDDNDSGGGGLDDDDQNDVNNRNNDNNDDDGGVTVPASAYSRNLSASSKNIIRKKILYKAEVRAGCLRELREIIFEKENITIDVAYDYEKDVDITPNVKHFELKDPSRLRPYQEEAVRRFLGGGKARNGIIVLPCGAGKSFTGIACAAALGKPCIVLCVNALSVLQWKNQFLHWTTLKENQICLFTGQHKSLEVRDVFITTYAMLLSKLDSNDDENDNSNNNGPRKAPTETMQQKMQFMNGVRNKAWGALLLDEVHGAVAEKYQTVLDQFRYHVAIGLTATLLREDDKIGNLRFLVGPKLFEANWLELARAGHLATVHCVEVRCPLPAPFLSCYLGVDGGNDTDHHQGGNNLPNKKGTAAATAARRKNTISTNQRGNNNNNNEDADTQQQQSGKSLSASALSKRLRVEALNPYKIWVVQSLIAYHTVFRSPADKVIVFCDSRVAVRYFARVLGIPYMLGETPQEERECMLHHFKHNPRFNVILLSRVGDIALDIPEATVVIQVTGLGASRRQEAQRLGRILRPKPPSLFSANAFFYTLVSTDTDEALAAFSRQQWLRDQGFSYRVTSAESVMTHFEEKFLKKNKKNNNDDDEQQQDDKNNNDNGSSGTINKNACPVPTNRWVCVASQSAQHHGQRGHPTLWQVRTVIHHHQNQDQNNNKNNNNSNSSSSIQWRNLPPAICAVLEDAFISGTGLVGTEAEVFHGGTASAAFGASKLRNKALARELQHLHQSVMAPNGGGASSSGSGSSGGGGGGGAHVLIPCLRGVVRFDSMDTAQSNGSLNLFNDVAARQSGSQYPEAALGLTTPLVYGSSTNLNNNQSNNKQSSTKKGVGADGNVNNSSSSTIIPLSMSSSGAAGTRGASNNHHNNNSSSSSNRKNALQDIPTDILLQHPILAVMPNVELNAETSIRMCQVLGVDPKTFLGFKEYVDEYESMISTSAASSSKNNNNNNNNAGSVLQREQFIQEVRQIQKQQNAMRNAQQQNQQDTQQQQLPLSVSFRIRRFGGTEQHNCDVQNPTSMCVSALIHKIHHSDTSGILH